MSPTCRNARLPLFLFIFLDAKVAFFWSPMGTVGQQPHLPPPRGYQRRSSGVANRETGVPAVWFGNPSAPTRWRSSQCFSFPSAFLFPVPPAKGSGWCQKLRLCHRTPELSPLAAATSSPPPPPPRLRRCRRERKVRCSFSWPRGGGGVSLLQPAAKPPAPRWELRRGREVPPRRTAAETPRPGGCVPHRHHPRGRAAAIAGWVVPNSWSGLGSAGNAG